MTAFTFSIAQNFERPDLCQADLQHFQGRVDLYWINVKLTGCPKTLVTLCVDPVREQTNFDPQQFDFTPQRPGLEWENLGTEEQTACFEQTRRWFRQQPEYTQQVEALTAAWSRLKRPSALEFQQGVSLIMHAMKTGNQGFSPFVARALKLMEQHYREPQTLGHLSMVDAVRQEARNILVHAPTLFEKAQQLPTSGVPEDVQTNFCSWIGQAASYGDALRRLEFTRWVLEQARLGVDLRPVLFQHPRLVSLSDFLKAQNTIEEEDKALGALHVLLLQVFLLLE